MNENENKKKPRLPRVSFLVQIGALFVLSAIVTVIVIVIVTGKYRYNSAIKDSADAANAAVDIGYEVLQMLDPDNEIETDAEIREDLHDTFRLICDRLDVKYLYCYKVDESGTRHHLVSAAKTDEDDAYLNEHAGFGTVSDTELRDPELHVLAHPDESGSGIVSNKYGSVFVWVQPVLDDQGKVQMLIAADYSMDETLQNVRHSLARSLLAFILVFLFTILIALILIRYMLFKPLKTISLRMENFLRDRNTDAVDKHFLRNDEISDINASFVKMANELNTYLNDIERLTTEKVAGKVELSVARKIQNGMVSPQKESAGAGYEAYAIMTPAKEIGGDFYDLIPFADGHFAFVIGDVSGKGVTAAMFMVMVRNLIRDRIRQGYSAEQALRESNAIICEENPEGMFATVTAGVFEPATGRLVYANAGHLPPFVFGSSVRKIEIKPGIALGLFEDADICEEELILKQDEGLLLYTDGVFEAINSKKEQFGEARICEALAYKATGAKDMIENLRHALRGFVGETEPFDDITALALCRKKAEESLRLKPELAEFGRVKERLFYELPDDPDKKKIILACEEWFVNIVSYAGASSVLVTPKAEEKQFTIVFEDDGIPFDPVKYKAEEKDFEDYDQGGMGILIVKDTASGMTYERVQNRNVLKLIFGRE